MKKIILATSNEGKVKEFKYFLSDYDFEIYSLKDMNINLDIMEDGKTYEENAYKKAMEVYKLCNKDYIILADDSGLEIDCLNGAPGLYSARFSNNDKIYNNNIEKVLDLMKDIEDKDRTCRLVCTIIAILPNGKVEKAVGEWKGIVAKQPKGESFGYSRIFFDCEYEKTKAELEEEVLLKKSPRAKAVNNIIEKIKK